MKNLADDGAGRRRRNKTLLYGDAEELAPLEVKRPKQFRVAESAPSKTPMEINVSLYSGIHEELASFRGKLE